MVSVGNGCFRKGTVGAQGAAARTVSDVCDAGRQGHAPTEARAASQLSRLKVVVQGRG